jgi:hypothetical protein
VIRPAAWSDRLRVSIRNPSRAALLTLAALLVISIAARIWLARQIVTPWIMVDELLYSEMAKSFATSGHFLVRDAPSGINNVVYPGLISPAWLFHPMATTYGLAKAINVVLMTSTAVPVYLWGRRLVSTTYALLAVALVLLMPSFVYSGMLMTENAFLPAFVLAAFAFALALERPTLVRQLVAFAAILLAVAIRYQGLVLLLVLPTAIVLKVALELRAASRPSPGRFVLTELRRYWISGALVIGAGCIYVLLQIARGHKLASGLGSYQAIVGKGYSFDAARHWILLHGAELGFSVGMLPASAFLLLLGLAVVPGETRSEAERAFLAVTAASIPWIVVEVAVFASRFSLRVEERYMFFLAPLLFLAFALWLDRGVPRPPVLAAAAAAIPVALLFALPLGSLLNVSILSDTFGLIPLLRLSSRFPGGIPEVRHFMLAGGVGAALLFVLWPRRAFPELVFPASVAAFLVLSTYPILGTLHDYSRGLLDSAGTGGSASWIDKRVGSSADVAFLLGTTPESFPEAVSLWENEFWNRSLGPVYNLSTPEPAGGPETAVTVAPRSGKILTLAGRPVSARYVVSRFSFGLDGQLIAARPPFALYQTQGGQLRVAQAVTGVYGDGWMSADASFTRFVARSRGTITVTTSRAAWRGPDVPGKVLIEVIPLQGRDAGNAVAVRRWVLHSGGGHVATLPTPARPFVVTVHVEPTFSPSSYGQPDTRQLGAQVSFHYRASP